jgi:hypothetical protein
MIWKALRPALFALIGVLGMSAVDAASAAEPLHDLGGTVWSSQGFGYVLEFRDPKGFVLHEVVSPLGSIRLTGGTQKSDGGSTAQLVSTESSDLADSGDALGTLRANNDELRWQRTGALDDIVFTRLAGRPVILDQVPDSSPRGVLEYFRRSVEAHHAFLQDRLDQLAIPAGLLPAGTTWDATALAAEKKLGTNTSRRELCNVMWRLLEPLGDVHTSLSDPKDEQCDYTGIHPQTYATMFPGTRAHDIDDNKLNEQIAKGFGITEKEFIDNRGLTSIANGQIRYGVIRDRPILYMRIVSFSDFAKGGFDAEMENLRQGLDQAAALYQRESLKAVILDLRYNDGGSDVLGIEIASRFNHSPYIAYIETARQDPNDPASYTPRQAMRVPVSESPGFRDAPVVILTSRLTISAGETITMAMMERSPGEQPVLRIGEPTQGVYADVISLPLPNGMVLGIPNERYLTTAGKNWEIHGIPPDIAVPVWAPADLEAGRDPALERAVQEIFRLL